MVLAYDDLERFYRTPLGEETRRLLCARVQRLWSDLSSDERVASLGFAQKLLPDFPTVSVRMTGMLDETFSCLVDRRGKPLADAGFNRVVGLHCVESEEQWPVFLREMWRVLKGEGRFLLIVPREGSAWAQSAQTPFGLEPAFSVAGVEKTLADQGFMLLSCRRALLMSPCDHRGCVSLAVWIEKNGPWFAPFFGGGVWIIEARKRVYGKICDKVKDEQCREDKVFVPSPFPV